MSYLQKSSVHTHQASSSSSINFYSNYALNNKKTTRNLTTPLSLPLPQSHSTKVIDAGTPRFALKGRIKQYMEFADWREWEKATGKQFPTIMFICPTEEMQKYLARQIPKMLEENSSEFTAVLTIQDQLAKGNVGTSI